MTTEWLTPQERAQYDEAQGLTNEMVADYLTRQGWTAGEISSTAKRTTQDSALGWISKCKGLSLQQLLREINPRMRTWPSTEARKAHRGPWLVLYIESGAMFVGDFRPYDLDVCASRSIHADIIFDTDEFARFWPCDERGNKVRWPETAAGEML